MTMNDVQTWRMAHQLGVEVRPFRHAVCLAIGKTPWDASCPTMGNRPDRAGSRLARRSPRGKGRVAIASRADQ
jgi:hypothetical protein